MKLSYSGLFVALLLLTEGPVFASANEPSVALVKDINTGSGSSSPSGFTMVGESVLFWAFDPIRGSALWRTDGTELGTALVKDIDPQTSQHVTLPLVVLDNQALFSADDGINGRELWRTDGTTTGTVLTYDIFPGPGSSNPITDQKSFARFQQTVVFSARSVTPIGGVEAWISDGTGPGTMILKDIRPGPGGSSSSPRDFTISQGALFFAANDGASGTELWTSNATATGTFMVKDINPGSSSSNPAIAADLDGSLFFLANDLVHGREPWISDGTAAGTVLVRDVNPGAASAATTAPQLFAALDGALLFMLDDGSSGGELWRSDGTASGTVLVRDINPGPNGSSVFRPTTVGDVVFFGADDGIHGVELWRSDGTESGTFLVKDIRPGPPSSSLGWLTGLGDRLYFSASDGIHGDELWMSDGTEEGTVMVADLNPGPADADPDFLTAVGGGLYFNADDGVHGKELWRTIASVSYALDIRPGSCPNPLNAQSPRSPRADGGLMVVAVLGDEERDVHRIDIESLRLEGVAPLRYAYRDVGGPFSATPACACPDPGPDGLTDIQLSFSRRAIASLLTNGPHFTSVELTLTGNEHDGTPLSASDCVTLVGPSGP